jgi:hypothetical protein
MNAKGRQMERTAWTEPYTARERLSIRWDLKRYDIAAFFREGIWRGLAFKMPDKIAYWCFIQVMSHAWCETNKEPDAITYSEAANSWEARR